MRRKQLPLVALLTTFTLMLLGSRIGGADDAETGTTLAISRNDDVEGLLNLIEQKIVSPAHFVAPDEKTEKAITWDKVEGKDYVSHVRHYVRKPEKPPPETEAPKTKAEERTRLAEELEKTDKLEVYVYVKEDQRLALDVVDYKGTSRLPTLDEVRAQVALLARLAKPADLRHRIHSLRYVSGDRALFLLNALGYNTCNKKVSPSAPDMGCRELLKKGDYPYVLALASEEPENLTFATPVVAPSATPGASPALPQLGGSELKRLAAGDTSERLLIVYEHGSEDEVARIQQILREQVDQPARQLRVEALVIEVNSGESLSLGINYDLKARSTSGPDSQEVLSQFGEHPNPVPSPGTVNPFTFSFGRLAFDDSFAFNARIKALQARGKAKILSNPSVLVLDGRQATIQIGQSIPVATASQNAQGTVSGVQYFPVGIVLNIRPRVSLDEVAPGEHPSRPEILMQVETIVSDVAFNQVLATTSQSVTFEAPTINARKVQTFVRVANDTPFIIGGLVASNKSSQRNGIPGLSRIPLLGALFRATQESERGQEVIIVITPHLLPQDEGPLEVPTPTPTPSPVPGPVATRTRLPSAHSVSESGELRRDSGWVIPQENKIFDGTDHELFHNTYRIQARDLFDLGFLSDSRALNLLKEDARKHCLCDPYRDTTACETILRDGVPGEEHLVVRILFNLLKRRTDLLSEVRTENLLYRPLPTPTPSPSPTPGPGMSIRIEDNRRFDEPGQLLSYFQDARKDLRPCDENEAKAPRKGKTYVCCIPDHEFEDKAPRTGDEYVSRVDELVFVPHSSPKSSPSPPPKCHYPESLQAGKAKLESPFANDQATLRCRTFAERANYWSVVSPLPTPTPNHYPPRQPDPPLDPDGTWRIVLASPKIVPAPVEVLRGAVVLKQVLELNPDLQLTLRDIRVGRQIVLPNVADVKGRQYVLDAQTARFFQAIYNYNELFEKDYKQQISCMETMVGSPCPGAK